MRLILVAGLRQVGHGHPERTHGFRQSADFAAWLDPANRDTARLQALLAPAPTGGWEAVPVSRAVNSPDHDEPDCIEPLVSTTIATSGCPAVPQRRPSGRTS